MLFSREATNWKYILILVVFTVFAGGIILAFAKKVSKDILAISQRYEVEKQ